MTDTSVLEISLAPDPFQTFASPTPTPASNGPAGVPPAAPPPADHAVAIPLPPPGAPSHACPPAPAPASPLVPAPGPSTAHLSPPPPSQHLTIPLTPPINELLGHTAAPAVPTDGGYSPFPAPPAAPAHPFPSFGGPGAPAPSQGPLARPDPRLVTPPVGPMQVPPPVLPYPNVYDTLNHGSVPKGAPTPAPVTRRFSVDMDPNKPPLPPPAPDAAPPPPTPVDQPPPPPPPAADPASTPPRASPTPPAQPPRPPTPPQALPLQPPGPPQSPSVGPPAGPHGSAPLPALQPPPAQQDPAASRALVVPASLLPTSHDPTSARGPDDVGLDAQSREKADGLLSHEQELRAKLHQQHRSIYEHVCHHLVWHLDQQRSLAQGMLTFIRQRESLDMQYATALAKMPPIPIASGTPPTLRAAFVAMSEIPGRSAQNYRKTMEATAQGPLKKLTQLVAEMDAANKAIRGQITKALSRLSGTHQEVQALMKALHKGMAGTFHREDPYLLALKIKKAVLTMSDVEQEAGVAVCTLLQDVRRIHSRNVDCLRMVITEYFDCQRHAPMQQLRDIEAASAVISNMDAADYQNTIVEVYRSLSSGDLHDGDDVDTKLVQALQQTSKVGHLPFQFDVQNMVQHQGILNLKSFLGLWYSRLFVLSKYGFLHYFGDDLLVPEGTLQLSKCRIEGAEEPDTFVLTEVNMLLDSHNVIKCNSKDEMLLWVAELRDFCRK